MPEVTERVVPVQVHLACDCGGQMVFTGSVFTMNPALYEHICKACDKRQKENRSYPFIRYEGGLFEFERAGGDVICEECGCKYLDHVMFQGEKDDQGHPFLHMLCDGTLVKL